MVSELHEKYALAIKLAGVLTNRFKAITTGEFMVSHVLSNNFSAPFDFTYLNFVVPKGEHTVNSMLHMVSSSLAYLNEKEGRSIACFMTTAVDGRGKKEVVIKCREGKVIFFKVVVSEVDPSTFHLMSFQYPIAIEGVQFFVIGQSPIDMIAKRLFSLGRKTQKSLEKRVRTIIELYYLISKTPMVLYDLDIYLDWNKLTLKDFDEVKALVSKPNVVIRGKYMELPYFMVKPSLEELGRKVSLFLSYSPNITSYAQEWDGNMWRG